MRIDILIGENTYGTIIHFSKSLANALERQGVKTRLFWIGDGHFFHAFYEISKDPPDFTCSFSAISLERRPLGDLWQIPHLFLMVDPPIYFLYHLSSKYGWVGCVDQLDCAFVRDLNCPRVFFLPHAADEIHKTPVQSKRAFDAVFFGTCIDYEAVADSWHKSEKEVLLAASEKVLSESDLSIAQVLIQMGIGEEDLPHYHTEVDRYIRGKDRIALIRSLGDYPVHIWGDGPWKKYFPDHTVCPGVHFAQSLEIMKESKVILNSSPRFKSGAHERIFYSLMCGANVYTGSNPYLKAILPEVLMYTYGIWERPCFKNWHERAEAAQERVLRDHTWNARAKTLLDILHNHNSLPLPLPD